MNVLALLLASALTTAKATAYAQPTATEALGNLDIPVANANATATTTDNRQLAQTYKMCVQRYSYTDFVGGDVGTASGPDPDSCLRRCDEHPVCKSFTWTNYNGGTCWLKSGDMEAKLNSDATSYFAMRGQDCPKIRVIWRNRDMPGGDIKNLPGKDVYQCYDQCLQVAGCKWYTWTNFNGGTCWLKDNSAKGMTTDDKGIDTGVISETVLIEV